jgi:peptide deformylase
MKLTMRLLGYSLMLLVQGARIAAFLARNLPLRHVSHFSAVVEEVDPGQVQGLCILKYPHPSLRATNIEITKFDDDLRALSKRLFSLMYAAKGVGLAAPQVGENVRLMVYNEAGDSKKWLTETVLVNPIIVDKANTTEVDTEGCLSFPGMNGPVSRHSWIKVQAQNLRGQPFTKKYVGYEAVIFQHEFDHLNGVVYIDHLDEPSLKKVQPRLDELVAEFGPGGAL